MSGSNAPKNVDWVRDFVGLQSAIMKRSQLSKVAHRVGAPALLWVANRLAGPIHNFVAALGGERGADDAGQVLRRFGDGSACLVRPAPPRLFTFAATAMAAQITTPRSAGTMRSRSAQTSLPS
jgi:hypothetical protein